LGRNFFPFSWPLFRINGDIPGTDSEATVWLVIPPNAIRLRPVLYEDWTNRQPVPFAWKFTRQELTNWPKRASPHVLAASAARGEAT
jgi:hypothetical protein